MKHARAAEFADYLELKVPDNDFDMTSGSICIMGHINRLETGMIPRRSDSDYWKNAHQVIGDHSAAYRMFGGRDHYTGFLSSIKNWFNDRFRPEPDLGLITKPQAVRVLRNYARTGNVVWR